MNTQIDIRKEKIKLIFIYATFGTIGVVTHFIPLSSATIVFYRALFGGIFIILSTKLSGKKINIQSMKDNLPVLIATGFYMGLNWVLQFEAFKVSTVAIGTVCYNTMPIFLVIIASIIFKEIITIKTIFCIILATIGVFLVSNVINTGFNSNEVLGCVYGILGAIFYALIIIFNRKLSNIEMHDKIIFQFMLSAIVMAIYVAFIEKQSFVFDKSIDEKKALIGLICLIMLCIFHTGVCYVHFFNAASRLKAETVAILTYIDPVVAMILSYFFLKEEMTPLQFLGAVLILLSTLVNELTRLKDGIKE